MPEDQGLIQCRVIEFLAIESAIVKKHSLDGKTIQAVPKDVEIPTVLLTISSQGSVEILAMSVEDCQKMITYSLVALAEMGFETAIKILEQHFLEDEGEST